MKTLRPVILLLLMLGFIVPAVHFAAPPRFDETGYCILAKSLAEGHGYREIEKPDTPRHAHFPPGWPVALALVWKALPETQTVRVASAHAFTIFCWIGSVSVWGLWFKRVAGRGAFPLFLALAVNWLWIRLAGELRSESLFLLLAAVAIGRITEIQSKINWKQALWLGFVVGVAVLTRQVGVALAGAVVVELSLRNEMRAAGIAGGVASIVVLPWVLWQKFAGTANQAELLVQDELSRSLARRLADQALFYARRLPDSLFGPYVETATVFTGKPFIALVATVVAIFFCVILLVGLRAMFKQAATRPAALYFSLTMAILLVWPFTEAGRFLIPLVPVTLLAGWMGLLESVRRVPEHGLTRFFNERNLATLILFLTMPFGLYTWQKNARNDPAAADADFNNATGWMRERLPADSVILARHPGDVYWRTGLKSVPWPNANDSGQMAAIPTNSGETYLLVDQGRFVGDSIPGWMSDENLASQPDRFQNVEMQSAASSKTRLWRVIPARK